VQLPLQEAEQEGGAFWGREREKRKKKRYQFVNDGGKYAGAAGSRNIHKNN
jgi:hypothetical protein